VFSTPVWKLFLLDEATLTPARMITSRATVIMIRDRSQIQYHEGGGEAGRQENG